VSPGETLVEPGIGPDLWISRSGRRGLELARRAGSFPQARITGGSGATLAFQMSRTHVRDAGSLLKVRERLRRERTGRLRGR